MYLRASVTQTANVTTAGTLNTIVSLYESTVTNLIVTGHIDARDFVVLRDNMPNLTTLDLSGAIIDAYSGNDGTDTYGYYSTNYNINTIPQYAFLKEDTYLGSKLTSILLPNTLTEIGRNAFLNSSNLSAITIPASVTNINPLAFAYCYNLSVTFQANSKLTTIGVDAFISCNFSSITIPASVTSIDTYAFESCSKLSTVTFEANSKLGIINQWAFVDCNISSITIPASVIYIGPESFMKNPITAINIDPANGTYTSIDGVVFSKNELTLQIYPPNKSDKSYTIPSTVMFLADNSFELTNNLSCLTIPTSVISIGNNVFSDNNGDLSSIDTLISLSSTAIDLSTSEYVFNDGAGTGIDQSNCVLVVPYGSKAAYQEANQWGDFTNIGEYGIWNGTSNVYDASKWSFNIVPPEGTNILVQSGKLTINHDVTVGNTTIASNAKVTLLSKRTVTILGDLLLQSSDTTTGTFVDQGGVVTVGGTSTVQQFIPADRNWYISSPVATATSNVVKEETGNKLWNYNETSATNKWNEIANTTTNLSLMTGYVANVFSDDTLKFTGTMNTGTQTIILTRTGSDVKSGFNLIGNPYPSCVDWDMAQILGIDSSIWYRTQKAGNSYVFDTYNSHSKVGTNNNGKGTVTGIIPPMQAVWVHVKLNQKGSVTFDNSMRSHPATGNVLKADATTPELIRLQVANGANTDEAIVVFNTEASNAYDAWDSQKMFAESADVPQIYTTVGDEKVVINGLESTTTNSIIPLGFKTAKAGTFTISATEINGVDAVVLEDKLLNKTQDLTGSASYTFTSDNVDNTNRFAIRLKANSEITDINDISLSTITIAAQNHSIVVTTSETSGTINVYDLLDRVVETKAIEGSKTVLESTTGVYFVKVQTATNIETKKIIIE